MPVRDFLQDETTGGFAVVNGDFARVGGSTNGENIAAVKQALRIRLRLLKGENFLNEGDGVDYDGKILTKPPNPLTAASELTRNIAATPDVLTVAASKLVGPDADRQASIGYAVTTPYGPLADSVTP